MRRLLAFLLAILLFASPALADVYSDLSLAYGPYAETFGAPMFKKVSVYNEAAGTYKADAGTITIIFEITATNSIRTVLVYALSDMCAADFLCTCTAMISFLGDIDTSAFGALMNGFAMLRAGSLSTPYQIGLDSFDLVSDDQHPYMFLYANNDLVTN